jgi:uncharacterized spore protein YtfJ
MDQDNNLTPDFAEVNSEADAVGAVEATLDRFLATASVDMVYGEPVEHGDTLIIPCAEVWTGLGFGLGYGYGSAPGVKKEEGQGGETGGDMGEGIGAPGEAKPSVGEGAGGGGGGGGRTFSRPVAVVIASPEGVRVEPVVDVTKIGLAFLTVGGFIFGMIARMSRRRTPDLNEPCC